VLHLGTAPQAGYLDKIRPVGERPNFDTLRCKHRQPKTSENGRKLMNLYLGIAVFTSIAWLSEACNYMCLETNSMKSGVMKPSTIEAIPSKAVAPISVMQERRNWG